MPTTQASPFASSRAVLQSWISVATGDPETFSSVAAASSLIIHSRCRSTSKVIGSSCSSIVVSVPLNSTRLARRCQRGHHLGERDHLAEVLARLLQRCLV